MKEAPYTPSVNQREKLSFLDCFPTEYPTGGIGDYRESCLDVRNERGSIGSELFFKSYHIRKGKDGLEGLPASFGSGKDVETLEILCEDSILGLAVTLSYSAFEKCDIITRSVKVKNIGEQHLKLEKVYSACLDMDNKEFEMLTLAGSWARERCMHSRVIYLRGLEDGGQYRLEGTEEVYSGEELMKCGYLIPSEKGDFRSRLYCFIRCD